jgi:hypothetical protein
VAADHGDALLPQLRRLGAELQINQKRHAPNHLPAIDGFSS